MKAGPGVPFEQRFDTLAPVIDRVFDLDAVLRASVGSAWDSLSPNQQDLLRPVFRRDTIASYVNSFNRFNGQRFAVEPHTRPVGNGEQVVLSRITPPPATAMSSTT
jgi:phospholipid transport system substrate-binding protein